MAPLIGFARKSQALAMSSSGIRFGMIANTVKMPLSGVFVLLTIHARGAESKVASTVEPSATITVFQIGRIIFGSV